MKTIENEAFSVKLFALHLIFCSERKGKRASQILRNFSYIAP
jgi:hypothetical protein